MESDEVGSRGRSWEQSSGSTPQTVLYSSSSMREEIPLHALTLHWAMKPTETPSHLRWSSSTILILMRSAPLRFILNSLESIMQKLRLADPLSLQLPGFLLPLLRESCLPPLPRSCPTSVPAVATSTASHPYLSSGLTWSAGTPTRPCWCCRR